MITPKVKLLKKRIEVNLDDQSVKAFDDIQVFRTCECVSGDTSHRTPTGTFRVYRKEHPYRSKKYDAQMNYALFFHEGIALHQYHGPAPWIVLRIGRDITDQVGSHGCVRLQQADAQALFDWAPIGTKVVVSKSAP